jgi:hypothetical protein
MNNTDVLLQTIKEKMDALFGWSISFIYANDHKDSGKLQMGIEGFPLFEYGFFVINQYAAVSFDRLYGMSIVDRDSIFIAAVLTEKVKKELRDNYISYIEMNGDAFIHKHPLYVSISGSKKTSVKMHKPNRAFSKTGLKIIFAYLTTNESLDHPVRIWASMLDVGYSNFHYVNQGLKDLKFLIVKDANTMVLHNKKALLERWVQHYEERLKPALFIGRFRFVSRDDYKTWEMLDFVNTSTDWGGEPAAAVLTGNLEPQLFTIYTLETKAELAKKYRIIPDEKGDIAVYENFYRNYPFVHMRPITHPILIYADLIITQESRNMKIAKDIYEQYIQY